MEDMGDLGRGFGYEGLDGVGEWVERGRRSEGFRESVDELGMENRDGGDMVGV